MEKIKEDLSGPYESWAKAPLNMAHAQTRLRVTPMALAMLGAVLATGVLNTWALVSGVLHPLWSKPSEAVLLSLAISSFVGAVVLCSPSNFVRWHAPRLLVGLCLMLPMAAMVFAPLFLYANQVGDSNSADCAPYNLLKKTVVKGRGYAYELTLSDAAGQQQSLRIPRAQYDELHEGQPLWIQVGPGLFGIRYAKQISGKPLAGCGGQ